MHLLQHRNLRNDIAGELGAFLAKGLRLRSIDRKATTAAQERAIADMEPTVISVQEGEIILRRGDRVTAADLEKYQNIWTSRWKTVCCYQSVYLSPLSPSFLGWFT